ncbi:MAG TPA: molybdopterin-dependent oxidoreductase [Pirellulales bacterium]|jgi:hypothetical protein
MLRHVPVTLCLLVSLLPCRSGVAASAEPAKLTIVDEQGQAHELSALDLAKLPRRTVSLPDEPGTTIEYRGVQLADVLTHCGVVLGKEVRGPRVASYVLVEATDGYRVLLAIAEIDPATTDKVVLLADQKDNIALPDREGPFRLVIPDDKRPVRWIRMIKRISVRKVPAD